LPLSSKTPWRRLLCFPSKLCWPVNMQRYKSPQIRGQPCWLSHTDFRCRSFEKWRSRKRGGQRMRSKRWSPGSVRASIALLVERIRLSLAEIVLVVEASIGHGLIWQGFHDRSAPNGLGLLA
jgi:hypothetical protein